VKAQPLRRLRRSVGIVIKRYLYVTTRWNEEIEQMVTLIVNIVLIRLLCLLHSPNVASVKPLLLIRKTITGSIIVINTKGLSPKIRILLNTLMTLAKELLVNTRRDLSKL
jgi:hypothetical protein